ncbi:MAG: hypothetical protein FWD73_10050 [Polyangiaceae bacterium]|nr:hypothetical protein [Polyangiaceae bacterium]
MHRIPNSLLITTALILVGCSSSSGTDDSSPGDNNGTMGSDTGAGSDGNVNDGDSGDSSVAPTRCAEPPCEDGTACEQNSDCVSQHCNKAQCVAASCTDGVKDGDETDVDCGGSCSPCAMSQKCATNADCSDGVCVDMQCAAPTADDEVQNGNETDVDCGSSGDGTDTHAPACDVGKKCNDGSDCTSLSCTGGVCVAPTCNDQVKNGDETAVDCGGSCGGCVAGQACKSKDDCADGVCTNSKCAAATCNDKVKNGDETDTDCGGSCGGCVAGQACVKAADCLSKNCNAGTCASSSSRSCDTHHGGDTCGPNGNDDCCASLPIADANSVKLDKYNITAGRYRQFVNYLVTLNGGNMRAWLTDPANKPADWPANWELMLPTTLDNKKDWVDDGHLGAADFTGIYQELGPDPHGNDSHYEPWSGNGACNVGDHGARTYWLPDDVNARFGDPPQYPQDMLDERSLNCTTAPMLAAFCAWDGGRLAKRSELDTAWGGNTYPWGPQTPVGYCYAHDTDPKGNDDTCTNPEWEDPRGDQPPPVPPAAPTFYANFNYNYWGYWNGAPNTMVGSDYSIFVAPPGSFPLGNGPKGHADLGGNVINATYDSVACNNGNVDDYGIPCVKWSRSGSWQGHPVGYDYERPARFKYLAMGGRCVHF